MYITIANMITKYANKAYLQYIDFSEILLLFSIDIVYYNDAYMSNSFCNTVNIQRT